jgi:two-component system cell cycle sensor histidine kinase PleC
LHFRRVVLAIESRAHARLSQAVEAMEHGFALFDGAGHKVLANSRYINLHEGPAAGAKQQPAAVVELPIDRWFKIDENLTPAGDTVRVQTEVTELVRGKRDVAAAKEIAEAANRAKTEFLANMSHELRTPLNAVLGFSEIIQQSRMGPVDVRYRDYAAQIHASGRHLLEVISDILDLSKIEVGRLTLREELVDIAEVVGACQRLIAERAEAASVQLTVALAPNLPPVHADKLRLKQILLNLLSNAVKFTPAGGQVTVSAALDVAGGLALQVKDTGIGMSEQEIRLALEPFRQVDNALNRRFEGTGLGLSLVQKLTDLHGGRLAIESAPGVGTVVRIHLGVERVQQRTIA